MQHGWTGLGRPQGVRLVSEGSIFWACRRAPATRLAVLSRVLVLEKVFMNNKYNRRPAGRKSQRQRDASCSWTGSRRLRSRGLSLRPSAPAAAGRATDASREPATAARRSVARRYHSHRRRRAPVAPAPRRVDPPPTALVLSIDTQRVGFGARCLRGPRRRSAPNPHWCGARTGRGANKAHHADVTWC